MATFPLAGSPVLPVRHVVVFGVAFTTLVIGFALPNAAAAHQVERNEDLRQDAVDGCCETSQHVHLDILPLAVAGRGFS